MQKRVRLSWMGIVMVLVCLVSYNLVVQAGPEGQRDEGGLVRYFPALEEPNWEDAHTYNSERVSLEELQAKAPFEVTIPELTGWELSLKEIIYVTTYSKRYFNHVHLKYKQGERQMKLLVGFNHPYMDNLQRVGESFTAHGTEFTKYGFEGTSDDGIEEIGVVRWRLGELEYVLVLWGGDDDLLQLLGECVNQFKSVSVQMDKRVTPRPERDVFVWKGPSSQIAPHLTDLTVNLAQVGSFVREEEVIYFEFGDSQALRIEYRDQSKVALRQVDGPDYLHTRGIDPIERNGVTVYTQERTWPAMRRNREGELEQYEQTTYTLAWEVDGRYLTASSQNEDQVWKFFVILNAML